MNIYLIERTDKVDWDEYVGFVICAESKKEAVSLMRSAEEKYHAKWKITKVGVTHYKKAKILLDSFNAG